MDATKVTVHETPTPGVSLADISKGSYFLCYGWPQIVDGALCQKVYDGFIVVSRGSHYANDHGYTSYLPVKSVKITYTLEK